MFSAKRMALPLFLILFTVSSAQAETGVQLNSITGDFLKMIGGLLLVIAIMLLLYAVMRKKFSLTSNQQNRSIKIVEMRPLLGKKALCLIEVENRKLLLGIAEQEISLLANLDNTANFAAALQTCQDNITGECKSSSGEGTNASAD